MIRPPQQPSHELGQRSPAYSCLSSINTVFSPWIAMHCITTQSIRYRFCSASGQNIDRTPIYSAPTRYGRHRHGTTVPVGGDRSKSGLQFTSPKPYIFWSERSNTYTSAMVPSRVTVRRIQQPQYYIGQCQSQPLLTLPVAGFARRTNLAIGHKGAGKDH